MSSTSSAAATARLDRILADAKRDKEMGYRDKALKMYPHVCGRCAREILGKVLEQMFGDFVFQADWHMAHALDAADQGEVDAAVSYQACGLQRRHETGRACHHRAVRRNRWIEAGIENQFTADVGYRGIGDYLAPC